LVVYAGIGEGDGMTPDWSGDSYIPLPSKVCVGNKVGDTWVAVGSGDSSGTYAAGVYDRVVMLDPAASPNVIDVFVDSSLYRRVRW
jgi:hypothetical protein